MIKMLDVITEDYKHRYGCVMLFFNFPYLNKIQDAINPDDLYEESDDESAIEPTALIIDRIKPILNIKDAGKSESWKKRKLSKKQKVIERKSARRQKYDRE